MDRLDEIRARCEAATPGPWEPVNKSVRVAGTYKDSAPDGFSGGICNCIGNSYGVSKDHWVNVEARKNAAFIAHAREDIPYLLAEIERLQAENKRLDIEDAKDALRGDTLRGELQKMTARAEKAEAALEATK